MNPASVYLWLLCVGGLIYVVWRIRGFRVYRADSKRFYYGFWLCPLLLFSLNWVPGWRVVAWLFDGTLVLLGVAILLDFVYFFGLKTDTGKPHQWISGLLLVPVLLFVFRGEWSREAAALNLPHHGKALVWTDGLLAPQTYYFLKNELHRGEGTDDPNYGVGVFAPLNGEALEVTETHMLRLKGDGIVVSVGPFEPASLRVQAGMKVFANQPLGLLGKTTGVPGIRLQVEEGSGRFHQVLSGRLVAREGDQVQLGRNQLVTSNAPNRFRLE